ncbi:RAD52 motif-containing protein 1 isoform X2 [Simochromis diagramma]|uniref:RAD52 motif-containing protein 1 isoform X2 n=1 Tax=Simochromis diagramma TaxID=43689 RepID=UPI001A7EF678|nr:RAD52 motif-containing protein 1 isoform X2 [Simochromis diagramma]
MEVEVVDFRVPVESNKTVLVWDIPPTHGEAHIHCPEMSTRWHQCSVNMERQLPSVPALTHHIIKAQLHAVFSSFGPVYLLKVSPNAPLHPPGFYALIKFFSAAHAAAAQRITDGRPLLDDSPLKVKLSSKQTPHFLSGSSRVLSHAHCLELANHVLGFNGWTSDIITLKKLTNEEEGEEEEGGGAGQRRLKFGCVLQLRFPHHGQTSRGAAVLEDCFTCTGPDVFLQRCCRLQRLVREKALVQAFSSVLLILLGNGKVMVEVKQTPDQFLADDTEGVLQSGERVFLDRGSC